MTSPLSDYAGVPVFTYPQEGPPLDEQEALDLIGTAWHHGAELVAVPVQRCSAEFFTLRTGLAGAILQKFVNYRLRVAIVGDVSAQTAASNALRDFVAETNRGDQVWFVDSLEELQARLEAQRP